MEEQVVSRIAQTCRAAAMEMPRPTVRKWFCSTAVHIFSVYIIITIFFFNYYFFSRIYLYRCEHGYSVAFDKTRREVGNYFKAEASRSAAMEDASTRAAEAATSEAEAAAKVAPSKIIGSICSFHINHSFSIQVLIFFFPEFYETFSFYSDYS